jgi:UDP-glucose 4-epimerase
MSGRAWVTGGAGFIGSHLAAALVTGGARVSVLDDLSTGRQENLDTIPPGYCLHECDISSPLLPDLLAAERPSMIYHLAGDALVSRSVADPIADAERNFRPTLQLLEGVRRHSPESMILFSSTGAVYGSDAKTPFREHDPMHPVSPYAAAKLAAERYCFAYSQTYGLRTCSLRLFSVFGPRQRKQVVYDLIRKLHSNPTRLELYGDGTQVRDFSHVSNIVDAFLLAGQKADFSGEAVNVAGEELLTIHELALRVGQTRPGDSQCWVADTALLRGWGYRAGVSLNEGLRDTIDWFQRSPE